MWNRARSAVLGLTALTLAACGSIHPGDAAVVDDQAISMAKFDKTARIYCELTLLSAKQQGVTSVPNAQVRRQAISDLVTVIVARDLARQKGVTPGKQLYELSASQLKDIAKAFPKGDDAETVESAIENSQEIAAIAIALGEGSSGTTATAENQQELSSAGQADITAAFKDHDVSFAPRFGLSGRLNDLGPTGSLSVSSVGSDAPAEDKLPAAQRCA